MKSFLLLLYVSFFITSCNQPDSIRHSRQGDSAEIVKLLKDVYHWHDKTQNSLTDFSIIVKDSFQVGVNYDSLNKTIDALKKTDYFSSRFIDNYRKLADIVDNKLTKANPKLLNEINFSFQDADPWTGFQDSAPDFWDKFKIRDYTTVADSAFLRWKIQTGDWASDLMPSGFISRKGSGVLHIWKGLI